MRMQRLARRPPGRGKNLTISATATLVLGAATVGRAQVAGSWIGGATGDWQNPGNWSSNPLVPGNAGTAVFNSGQASVSIAGSVTLRHLRFDTPAQVTLGGNPFSFANLAWIESARSKRSAPGTHYYNGHEIPSAFGAGSLALRFTGPGALVLRGSNFWTGPTLADGGVQLGLGASTALPSSSGTLQLDNATIAALTGTTTLDLARPIQILPNGGTLAGINSTLRIAGGTFVGGGPLAFTGPAGVRLETNAFWAGDARVVGGGTTGLTITSTGGLPFYNSFAVSGALNVEYFSGPQQDRLGAGTLTLRGGTLSLSASSASESIGTLVLSGGQNVVTMPGTSGTFTLSATRLVRTERATLRVVADGLGGASGFGRQNRLFFSDPSNIPLIGGGGAPGADNISIIPFAHAQSVFGSPYTFVTYDPVVGLRALNVPGEFHQDFPTELISTANVRISGATNVNEPRTVNALLHAGLPQSISGDATLTITSGAIMGAGGGSLAGSISCPVDFGPVEGFVTNMTVYGPISGANGVTFNGTSTLSGASTWVGTTTVNGGTLSINLSAALVPGEPGPLGADNSPLVLMGRGTGAVLQVNGNGRFGRDILVNADPDLLRGFEPALRHTGIGTFSGAVELHGPLRIDGTAPILLSGAITGPGRLVIATGASSTVSISGNNTFDGGVHVNSGSLALLSDTAGGTGTLYFGDGIAGNFPAVLSIGSLTPNTSRTLANPIVVSDPLYLRTSGGGGGTLVLNGPIDLNGELRQIVAENTRVTINGPITGGDLRWAGEGTLTGLNSQWATYLALPPGSFSNLTITSGGALGGASARLTEVGSLGASSSAVLTLRGGISVPAQAMNLYATLRSDSGDNTWLGAVAARGTPTIQVASDRLIIAGGVTFATASTGFVLQKDGPGTLETKFIRGEGGELRLLDGTARILPDGTPAAESRVGTLTIAGGPGTWLARLDLSDNTLLVNYPDAEPTPFDNLASQVRSGYAGGAWDGSGIASSSAAGMSGRGLGYAEAADLGYGTIAVGGIDSTTVIVRYTLAGDGNLDRVVDIADFALLASSFNQPASWYRGDFNYDGAAGIADFALLAAHFNQSLPAVAGQRPLAAPEPATVAFALPAALCFRRRRD